MTTMEKYLPQNWHSFFFDAIFVVLNFTFFPLVGWIFVEWFEIWLAGKGENLKLVLFASAILCFFAIASRLIALYLKRYPIRKRNEKFNSGLNLFWLNSLAIFASYLVLFVGFIELLWGNFRSESIYALINVSLFLIFVSTMLFIEYRLFKKFDEPLKIKQKELINKRGYWRFSTVTEFSADALLFVYILVLQCFYYAYMAETLNEYLPNILKFELSEEYFVGAGLRIFVFFLVFLFLYAAPRLIYSKSYDEETNYWMIFLVFASSIAGFFLPKSIAWLF